MKQLLAAGIAIYGMLGAAQAAKPNIVFVLADDLGYGDVSAYNPNSQVRTVHMDSLAAAGMRFTNAHSASGICSPTRYSILTGDHPFRVGKATRVVTEYDDPWMAKNPFTVADFLRNQSYQTGYVGKWHLGYNVFTPRGLPFGDHSPTEKWPRPAWERGIENGPYNNGFNNYSFGHAGSADIPPYKYFFNDTWVDENSRWVNGIQSAYNLGVADRPADGTGIKTLRPGWMDTDWDFNQVQRRLQDTALAFIDRRAAGPYPFFLFLGLSGPHTPLTPNPDHQGSTPHNYTDYVKEVDDVVGSLVARLKSRGILDNTLIIVTSDNGANGSNANIGTHRGTGVLPNGKNVRGQKGDAWEGGHLVPYIARWGNGTPAGSRIKPGLVNAELINLEDFYRTMLALVTMEGPVEGGVPDDVAVDSWNMLPAYLGDGTDQHIREAQFSTSKGGAFAITQHTANGGRWKLIFCSGSGHGFSDPQGSIISPNQNFANLDKTKMQLFNLATDPQESTNLIANGVSTSELAKLKELHGLMRKYITSGRSNAGTTGLSGLAKSAATVGQVGRMPLHAWMDAGSACIHVELGRGPVDDIRLQLLDLEGRIIYQENLGRSQGELSIKVPGNRPGMHVLRLMSGAATLLEKPLTLL